MRTKGEAQKYLEQVERLEAIIDNKMIEKQRWKDIALGITANMDGERVQSSDTKNKMANAVSKCVDIEAEIDSYVDRLINAKKDVTQTIESLENINEYKVLHMRYIQFVPLTEIADSLGKEYSWVTTTHGRALKSVQRKLYERDNKQDERNEGVQ